MPRADEAGIRLRRGRPEAADAEHYARLADAAAGGGFRRLCGSAWLQALTAAYPARYQRTIFLEADGEIVGGIGFDSREDQTSMAELSSPSLRTRAVSAWRSLLGIRIDEVRRGELYLAFFAVYPSAQRRGFGTRLIDATAPEARNRGLRLLTAAVHRRNQASLSFVRNTGFEVTGNSGPLVRLSRSIGDDRS